MKAPEGSDTRPAIAPVPGACASARPATINISVPFLIRCRHALPVRLFISPFSGVPISIPRIETPAGKRTLYQALRVGKLKSAVVTKESNFSHFLGLQPTEIPERNPSS